MNLVFNAPHVWPRPPQGWAPPPGWQPDPAWPPAPPGWRFWVPAPRPVPAIEQLPTSETDPALAALDGALTGTTDLSLLRELVGPHRGAVGG